jgi:hypothetical protein
MGMKKGRWGKEDYERRSIPVAAESDIENLRAAISNYSCPQIRSATELPEKEEDR